MPMRLEGSCRCGVVTFSFDSHTPSPYQRCYCSICRKSAGGGGYAINIMGLADTLKVKGKSALGVWNAPIDGHKGSADRHYCKHCGTPPRSKRACCATWRCGKSPLSACRMRRQGDGRGAQTSRTQPSGPLQDTAMGQLRRRAAKDGDG